MVSKHLGLRRTGPESNHPLFSGPTMIHGISDYQMYANFLTTRHTVTALDTDNEIAIGSDRDKALRKAITCSFPCIKCISCERHLQNNCIDALREKVGVKADTHKQITHTIFGHNTGMMSSDREVIFQERANEAIGLIHDKTPTFKNHYINNILPVLTENIQMSWKYELVHWTNNNCESMNHILKVNINWIPVTPHTHQHHTQHCPITVHQRE